MVVSLGVPIFRVFMVDFQNLKSFESFFVQLLYTLLIRAFIRIRSPSSSVG